MIPLTGWSYCKQKDIPNTYIDADLTDYPYPIFINGDTDIGVHALPTGYDIRFTASDGTTLLFHERRSFAVVAGAATGRWIVKIPARHAAGGDFIYIHYGKVGAPDVSSGPDAYDANFKGVWPLDESYGTGADNYKDRTANAHHLTLIDANANSGQVDGPINKAVDLNGDADYLKSAIHSDFDPGGAMTIEGWHYPDSLNFVTADLAQTRPGYTVWRLRIQMNANDFRFGAYTPPADPIATSTTHPTTGTLYYLVGTYDRTLSSNRIKIFMQGALEGQADGIDADIQPAGSCIWIGTDNISSFLDGPMAEVRYSNIARSSAWIKATLHDIVDGYQAGEWGAEVVAPITYTLAGSIDGVSSLTGNAKMTAKLAGSIQAASTFTGETKTTMRLAGAVAEASYLGGGMKIIMRLAGTMAGISAMTGNLLEIFSRLKAIIFTVTPRERIVKVPDRKRIRVVPDRGRIVTVDKRS
jgi:hypothetical protein